MLFQISGFLHEIQATLPETSPNGCAEQLFSNVYSTYLKKRITDVGIPETSTFLESANVGNGDTPTPLENADVLNGWSLFGRYYTKLTLVNR